MISKIIIKNYRRLQQQGLSLVEILVYVALLLLFVISVAGIIQSFTKVYNSMRTAQNIELSAETAMERMTRAIRDSLSVDIALSVLGTSPGTLTLNATDDNGVATSIQFFLSDQRLHIKEGAVDIGPLTSSSVRVTNLVFRLITTAKSKAVKIEFTIDSSDGGSNISKPFHSTVVLRGSYPLQ